MNSKRRSGFQNDTRAYASGKLNSIIYYPSYGRGPSYYQARAFYNFFSLYV